MNWPQNLPVVCHVICLGEFSFVLNKQQQRNTPLNCSLILTAKSAKRELIVLGVHNKGPSEWSQSPRVGKGQQALWMASGWGSSRIQEGGVQVWMAGEDKGQVSAVKKSEERIWW